MLYIMRHGTTDWNKKRKLQGRTDIPLNAEGIALAERAREEYRDVSFDRCYVSPLTRARQTAEIVLEGREIPVIVDERLREMSFGICEGMEDPVSKPDSPVHVIFTDPANYKVPVEDGESFEELFARTGDFLQEEVYPRLERGEDILIVGHGAMNCSIVCQYLHRPLEEFWKVGIPNCKLMNLDAMKE